MDKGIKHFNCFACQQQKEYENSIIGMYEMPINKCINQKEMNKEFTKKDLKSGIWVELRNGDRYMVIKDCDTKYYGKQCFCLIRDNGFIISDEYTDCLTYSDSEYNKFDICAVYSTNGDVVSTKTYTGENMSLVWRRNAEGN